MQTQVYRSIEMRNSNRRNYFVTETKSPISYYEKYIYTNKENLRVTSGKNQNLL